jgi:hypothetical protein
MPLPDLMVRARAILSWTWRRALASFVHGRDDGITEDTKAMQTLDEMRDRMLLTADQHPRIGAWIARARTPEGIMAMPPSLWRKLELASVLMSIDGDLSQPPKLTAP